MAIKCPKCQSDNIGTAKFCSNCATRLTPDDQLPFSLTKTLETPVCFLSNEALFAGKYRIVEEIGRGGMGVVYRAHDAALARDVAIKVLPPEFASDPERLRRFEQEAKAAGQLNHPNILVVYDVGSYKGAPYLVTELLEGESLRQSLAGGELPVRQAIDYGVQVARGLAAAHEKGIVHRDLKPENAFITRGGFVKILDFGLAKLRSMPMRPEEPASTDMTVTERGAIIGTAPYMSPEQAQGKPVDARTDIFSFGAVLYEMITGRRAFDGDSSVSILSAILTKTPPAASTLLKGVPAALDRILKKCLEKDPANRYGSAAEVIRELKALELSLAPARSVRLSRKAWIAVGAAVVLAVVLAGWLWRKSSRERWALQTATPEITRLVEAGEYVQAAALTREARTALPKDPMLEKLWIRATGEVSIASEPSDAVVSILRYRGDPNAWETLGKTPLQKVRLPRETYVWRLVKPGFASAFFIAEPLGPPPPGFPSRPNINMMYLTAPNINIALKLRPEESVPPEMVVVLGGTVGLAYPLEQAPAAPVDDFLIDRHEVTNEEYKKFVDAGGYEKREFWTQPFVRDGHTIPWEEAGALFREAAGRPGPVTWETGDYPKGHEKYPVAGVSWYEAAAYAEFVGKSLPTAYHWTRAS